jgi:hypothetical protein
MDTLVDPSEQQTRRSSSRMRAHAPSDAARYSQPSVVEEAEVQWFARTGPFPALPPSLHPREGLHPNESLRPKEPPRPAHRAAAPSEVEIADEDVDVVMDSFDDEAECDTLVLATRRFTRARTWQSED